MKQLFFILAAVLFLAGCEQTMINESSAALQAEMDAADSMPLRASMQLSLDKELYHSNEMMNITVEIDANTAAENVSVKVYGIYASRNRIELSKTVDLEQGNNVITFDFRTPSCNTCSGIRAGTYEITAEAGYEGITIKETKQIEIQQ